MRLELERLRLPPLPSPAEVRVLAADILTPPADIDVAEAAELYRHLYNPGGGYSGPWRNIVAPYLVGPMRATTDPRYGITVFVAPAQSAKTELGLNFAAYAIEVDPSDFQIVLPEKQLAEDFSGRRLARMVEHSPALARRVVDETKFATTFDRCIVNLSWPTSSNASSKPVPRNWLDERDSMVDDVGSSGGEGGEGDPVALYDKRSQTFGSRRMTLVTSSPKRPPIKGAAAPVGKHEAPATTGVLALYNAGTRRQFYWPCKSCGEGFVTRVKDLHYAETARSDDPVIAVWFACPACGQVHDEADRRALWAAGEWRAENEERFTNVDSYWLFGPQAAFITLDEIVRKKLKAEETREKTGSDTELRTFWNVDAGEVYMRDGEDDPPRAPEAMLRAAADLPLGQVPAWAQVLVAAVDVQGNRFEIAWQAFGPNNESAVVDVQKLLAVDENGRPVLAGGGAGGAIAANLEPVDPALRLDHWRALVEAVFDRRLPLASDPSKGLLPLCVAIDTGGKAGVTDKAYAFARWLKRARPDLAPRAMMLKGRGGRNPVRVMRAPWDAKVTAKRKTNRVGVELWHVYTDELKDAVDARFKRAIQSGGERGADTIHVSRYLPEAVFAQLCAETRNEDHEWVNERQVANEAFDLVVYGLAAWIRLRGERINWERPPSWAKALEQAETISKTVDVPPPNADDDDREPALRPSPQPPAPPPPRVARAARRPRGGGWLTSWKT